MMRKIRFNIKYFYFSFLLCAGHFYATGQNLKVVSSKKEYEGLLKTDSLQKMVEIHHKLPEIVYDLRYATRNNFTGEKLYKKGSETYTRLAVVNALQNVLHDLQQQGYNLKIWDAYRPYSVTKKMWELIGDDRYVANPANGSNHNRGLAIDLTLMKNGQEIDMGTGFDNFSDTAHHSFTFLEKDVLSHRQLLKTTMEKWGFVALETEWWHYSFPNNHNYQVLDLPPKKLRN